MSLTYRQSEILDYLKEHKHAKISELSGKLYVSDATIRRELTEMKKLGLLERDHGGAVILESMNEIPVQIRQERNTQDKTETALIALHKLPVFKTIFFDNSSTALIMAQHMNLRHKTVVTNGLQLAMEVASRGDVNVVMTGGNLLYNTNCLTGAYTLRCIGDMHFNLMICSCTAIGRDGAFENSLEQAELKRLAMHQSTNKILLVDKTKFENTAMYRATELSFFNAIFTNADDSTIADYKTLNGVNIFNN